MTHLIGQGHRRIAFVSTDNLATSSVAERLQGYQQALAAAGVTDDPSLLFAGLRVGRAGAATTATVSKENVARIVSFLARSDATAVFALHDHLALEVLEAARAPRSSRAARSRSRRVSARPLRCALPRRSR